MWFNPVETEWFSRSFFLSPTVLNYVFPEKIRELGNHCGKEHRNQTQPEPQPALYQLSGLGKVI